jgi:hypothetical protein
VSPRCRAAAARPRALPPVSVVWFSSSPGTERDRPALIQSGDRFSHLITRSMLADYQTTCSNMNSINLPTRGARVTRQLLAFRCESVRRSVHTGGSRVLRPGGPGLARKRGAGFLRLPRLAGLRPVPGGAGSCQARSGLVQCKPVRLHDRDRPPSPGSGHRIHVLIVAGRSDIFLTLRLGYWVIVLTLAVSHRAHPLPGRHASSSAPVRLIATQPSTADIPWQSSHQGRLSARGHGA